MRNGIIKYGLLLVSLFCGFIASGRGGNANRLLEKGWAALVVDNDTEAFRYFGQAYVEAAREKDTVARAQALLNMGICTYGISYSTALEYCLQAMTEYTKLEKSAPAKAIEGRSRCLQLISTIKSRQGQFREAIALSREAMAGFPPAHDTTGTLGLIFSSLGSAYKQLQLKDSSIYYHRRALAEHLSTRNFTYLPTAYMNIGDVKTADHAREESYMLYRQAYHIADSTHNRQALVVALLGLGRWHLVFDRNLEKTNELYLQAKQIAAGLTDRSFYLKTLSQLLELSKQRHDFPQALAHREEMILVSDSMYSWDRQKAVKSMEMRFAVNEKDRELELLKKEQKITLLTNGLLWGSIGILMLVSGVVILFLRRINRRDKLLLEAKEALIEATEAQKELLAEQKRAKEQQMQMELEFKESQLSAMTLQMLQKNELMQELKHQLENTKDIARDLKLDKIISKGLNHDKEWSDFNAYFESINKNFFTRLKAAYPDISPNDRKICALIKLNLSIKEMAGILNISPDSVKTARYRLRKKLQLNTEDNLTEFILSL